MILSYLAIPLALDRLSIRRLEGALAWPPVAERKSRASAAVAAERPAGARPAQSHRARRSRPWPRRIPGIVVKAILVFHAWFIGSTALTVACFAAVDPAATVLAVSRKYVDGWTVSKSYPVKLKSVPLAARRMLVSVEDYKFWSHRGLDFEAIERAVEINKRIGRRMYGGSTLTMQTARTLFLVPVKSYVRKYLEVIVALEMEAILSKERILELYFSWAEWGKGVFGIEAASRRYYGLPAAKLDAERIARLVAILSSPIKYGPSTLARSKLLQSRYDFLEERYLR